MDQSISLNKFISDTGYCSRREADNLITSGRVLLNDKPATLGNRYKPGDTVEVDGSLITAAKKEKRVYLALNKPVGITTTTELHIKDNIISFVGYPKRIFPIGRLDKDSEGLIFLTNDGDIINKILRAANNHEKEYVVRVNKPVNAAFVRQMSQGVRILETTTLPCKVEMTGRQTFRITLTQGLNRQIRRMCEALGYAVVALQRVRIMNVKLDKLAVGKWRYLSEAEITFIKESVADSSMGGDENVSQVKRKKNRAQKPAGKHPKPDFNPDEKLAGTKFKSPKPDFNRDKKPTDNKFKSPKPEFNRDKKPSDSKFKSPKPDLSKDKKTDDSKFKSPKPPAKEGKPKSFEKPAKRGNPSQKPAPSKKGKPAARPAKQSGKKRGGR